jgi:hypothetical protein
MAKQVQIKLEDIPEDWSQDSADLINRVKFFIFLKFNLIK